MKHISAIATTSTRHPALTLNGHASQRRAIETSGRMHGHMLARGTLFLLACSILGGCSWFGGSDAPPKENKPKEVPLSAAKPSELSEDELIFRAKRYYEAALYRDARENFDAIKETYPLGPYAEFAEIKSADALYDEGSYGEAAMRYEELARNRPLSDAVPYLLFRAGRSHQLSQRGVGRDMSSLDRAQTSYEELLKRFPESRHARGAQQQLAEVLEAKAQYTAEIRDFYAKRGKDAAARSREQRHETVENPRAIQARAQAQAAEQASVIPGPVPDTRLVPLRVHVEQSAAEQRASTPKSASSTAVDPMRLRMVKIECRGTGDGRVQGAIVLNREVDSNLIEQPTIQSQDGGASERSDKISFQIPGAISDGPMMAPCGALGALSVNTNGVVTLSGGNFDQVTTTSMPNPPRVMVLASGR